MQSALFEGRVSHHRTAPARHVFHRRIDLLAIDLDEWDQVFRGRWLWGHHRFKPYSVRRCDHLGDPRRPLKEAVGDWIESTGRARPAGRIMLMTLPATFGFVMNPVSFFLCFDAADQLQWVVAEVNNTPWAERQCYLLDPRRETPAERTIGKAMHVSPFLPMDLQYRWTFDWSESRLGVAFHCQRASETILSVVLQLERKAWSPAALRRWVVRHPLAGLGVWLDIYTQALRLKLKGVPFYPHPRTREITQVSDAKASR